MQLSKELIEAVKDGVTNPEKHGFQITPIQDFFVKSETVTANHILAKAYIDHVPGDLPKVFVYIIMEQVFGPCNGKDAKGDLGYFLQVVDPIPQKPETLKDGKA